MSFRWKGQRKQMLFYVVLLAICFREQRVLVVDCWLLLPPFRVGSRFPGTTRVETKASEKPIVKEPHSSLLLSLGLFQKSNKKKTKKSKISRTTSVATKTIAKPKKNEPSYSLGLQSSHNYKESVKKTFSKYRLRPLVKKFDGNYSSQSNTYNSPYSQNSGLLEPRIVRFSVLVDDNHNKYNNNNYNNKQGQTPQKNQSNYIHSNNHADLKTPKQYDPSRPVFIPLAPPPTVPQSTWNSKNVAVDGDSANNNNNNNDNLFAILPLPFSVPTPFVPPPQYDYRTTTFSLAENLLQLTAAPFRTILNNNQSLLLLPFWNGSVLQGWWNNNNNNSNNSNNNNSMLLWNNENYTLSWPNFTQQSLSMPYLLDMSQRDENDSAEKNLLEQQPTTNGLAESLMQYMMEAAAGSAILQSSYNKDNNDNNNDNYASTTTQRPKTISKNGRRRPNNRIITFSKKLRRRRRRDNTKSSSLPEDDNSGLVVNDETAMNLIGKGPNDPVTMADLDRILRANGYGRRSKKGPWLGGRPFIFGESELKGELDIGKPVSMQHHPLRTPSSSSATNNKKNVAFPQPSVLSYDSLKWGTTVSSGLFFSIVSTTFFPSLWLVGFLVGAFYGFEIGKQLPEQTSMPLLPSMLVRAGARLARTSLQIYDFVIALVFMWKTGVLSYEYWKQYATLDQRFKIQEKVDAWNARFLEGKENFDKWERENEVGRKALAMLRTIWLVEERSLQGLKNRRRKQSKYRLIQLAYDLAYSVGQLIGSIGQYLAGGYAPKLGEFWRGLRLDVAQGMVSARIGAVLVSMVTLNLIGALFTLSPTLLGIVAFAVGILWPTWISEVFSNLGQRVQEIRDLGQGEEEAPRLRIRNRQDKERFHFYVSPDGRKRYYRTGQPFWPWLQKKKEVKRNKFLGFLDIKPFKG